MGARRRHESTAGGGASAPHGASSRAIGRQLPMGRDTIRCYLSAAARGCSTATRASFPSRTCCAP